MNQKHKHYTSQLSYPQNAIASILSAKCTSSLSTSLHFHLGTLVQITIFFHLNYCNNLIDYPPIALLSTMLSIPHTEPELISFSKTRPNFVSPPAA